MQSSQALHADLIIVLFNDIYETIRFHIWCVDLALFVDLGNQDLR